eukprot:SAG31_NODE_1262_length_9072_cov_11.697760_7_plen_376_part_00
MSNEHGNICPRSADADIKDAEDDINVANVTDIAAVAAVTAVAAVAVVNDVIRLTDNPSPSQRNCSDVMKTDDFDSLTDTYPDSGPDSHYHSDAPFLAKMVVGTNSAHDESLDSTDILANIGCACGSDCRFLTQISLEIDSDYDCMVRICPMIDRKRMIYSYASNLQPSVIPTFESLAWLSSAHLCLIRSIYNLRGLPGILHSAAYIRGCQNHIDQLLWVLTRNVRCIFLQLVQINTETDTEMITDTDTQNETVSFMNTAIQTLSGLHLSECVADLIAAIDDLAPFTEFRQPPSASDIVTRSTLASDCLSSSASKNDSVTQHWQTPLMLLRIPMYLFILNSCSAAKVGGGALRGTYRFLQGYTALLLFQSQAVLRF